MKRGWIAVLLLALTACGGGSDDGGSSTSAHETATAIEGKVDAVTKVEDLTEDTDINDLLGRPNGYKAATVLYDSRATCDTPGIDCGAVVEQWPDADAAQERADYIDSLGAIANEYDTVSGSLVLRVSGALKPSEAQEYADAF